MSKKPHPLHQENQLYNRIMGLTSKNFGQLQKVYNPPVNAYVSTFWLFEIYQRFYYLCMFLKATCFRWGSQDDIFQIIDMEFKRPAAFSKTV